jgi:glucose/arabinose dehydrogenase
VWAIDLTTSTKTVFLDVRLRTVTLGVCGPNTFDERGLLGVAFHPKYALNGLLYTYTSEPESGPPTFFSTITPGTADHQNVVAEWRVANPSNPASVVDPNSRRELMRVNWPQFNHNGGDMAFGPDGKLYISMGDGGGADDADGQLFNRPRLPNPGCAISTPIVGHQGDGNAQKLNVPLGKILRIDVDGRNSANGQYGIPKDNPLVRTNDALAEIWAYGFRNPYRLSFDTRTGDLFVGDVGQNDLEEVNLVAKGGNHGWNVKEGTFFFHINGTFEGFASPTPDPTRTIPSRLVEPIAQYDTHHEGHSVIGGVVYQGTLLPELSRRYVFGDFALLFKFPSGPHDYGRLFVMDTGGHNLKEISQLHVLPGGSLSLALLGFGQDASGEIYALGNVSGVPFPDPAAGPTGRVLKLVPAPEVAD